MVKRRLSSCLAPLALLTLLSGSLSAQQGVVTGRVTNATTLAPVPLATIRVVGDDAGAAAVSQADGSFELRLAPGVYDLLVEAESFAPTRFDRVRALAGQSTVRNLPLESQGYRLAGFIVTASRGTLDTEITAPSSSHAVHDLEIVERPAPSPVEHLRATPAVDVMTQGLQASNVVVRGFDNIFSGALRMLTDNRLAGLASLRVNLMHFLPLNDFDIERMEVVLGPGSALYGPDTANGVLHVITKSPLESQGTTLSIAGGERSLFQGAFRSAFLLGEELGVKVSGQLFRGDEWPYVDPAEVNAREICLEEREVDGATPEEAESACGRIGDRKLDIFRYAFEARADWRFSRRGTLVTTYGRTDASGIELTGLGAVQAENWIYQFFQSSLTYDRWFVQAYFNANEAGSTFLLRDGKRLIDRSTLGVAQIQNGFDVADGRLDITYGWDFFETRPRSEGTIYGDYEDAAAIREWGVYLQSRTALSEKIDLIAAGRIDSHSILPDKVFSPRLALVFQPNDNTAIRLAYNRAFSTPTTLNYFLDIDAGVAPDATLASHGYSVRAFGSGADGFAWRNPDGTLRGMRSPFNPAGPGELIPAVDQGSLWALALESQRDALAPDVLSLLEGLTPDASVGIRFIDANDTLQPLSELSLPDVPPVRESNTQSFEVGVSGVLASKLRVSTDVYYTRQNDFVSPLVVENPPLFLDGANLADWLAGAYVPTRAQNLVDQGLSVADATAQAAAEVGTIVSGIAPVPLAVVSSDVPEMANGGADLIATYRNVGGIDLWGADIALQWSVTPEWTASATYSHVSRNWFRIEGAGPIALNAPANKATVGVAYRDERLGLGASARLRYTGAFPVQSTQYVGTRCIPDAPAVPFQEDCIDAYALVDVTLGYQIPSTDATVQLSVSNVLNTDYRSFVGVPTVGRLAVARVTYDLF